MRSKEYGSSQRAAGYARVSSACQATEGLSLGEQERRLREQIERDGLECSAIYIDAGLSGRSAEKRPELQRMVADAEAGHFQTLYFPALDRLGRNTRDVLDILARLDKVGVGVKSLRGDVDTTSIVGKFQTSVMAAFAELESDTIGERTRHGKAASARLGRRNGGPRPYGYEQSGGVLTVIRHEAEVLRRMARESLAGKPHAQIARDLNSDGITTSRGRSWVQTQVSGHLRNPLYAGSVHYRGELHAGQHEAIFSSDIWAELEQLRKAKARSKGAFRARPTSGTHLLTNGMLRCGACGEAMLPRTTRNSQGRTYEMYACAGRLQRRVCDQTSIRREDVDPYVLAYFERVGLDVEALEREFTDRAERELEATRTMLTQAEREVGEKQAERERIERDYLAGDLTAKRYESLSNRLDSDEEAAGAQVERLRKRHAEIEAETRTATIEAQLEAFEYMAELRAAIVGKVRDAEGVAAVRAALLRMFESFTLHRREADAVIEPELELPSLFQIEVTVRPEVFIEWPTLETLEGERVTLEEARDRGLDGFVSQRLTKVAVEPRTHRDSGR